MKSAKNTAGMNIRSLLLRESNKVFLSGNVDTSLIGGISLGSPFGKEFRDRQHVYLAREELPLTG